MMMMMMMMMMMIFNSDRAMDDIFAVLFLLSVLSFALAVTLSTLEWICLGDLSTWISAQVAPPIPKGTYDYGAVYFFFCFPSPWFWVVEGGNSNSK